MKQVTLIMTKNNVEYILNGIVKYRLELMEDGSAFSERYRESLSNTGYLLELINAQYVGADPGEEIPVVFDIESYLNMFDVLAHRIEKLNVEIIEAVKNSNVDLINMYEEEKSVCKELYGQVNERRFEVLHL